MRPTRTRRTKRDVDEANRARVGQARRGTKGIKELRDGGGRGDYAPDNSSNSEGLERGQVKQRCQETDAGEPDNEPAARPVDCAEDVREQRGYATGVDNKRNAEERDPSDAEWSGKDNNKSVESPVNPRAWLSGNGQQWRQPDTRRRQEHGYQGGPEDAAPPQEEDYSELEVNMSGQERTSYPSPGHKRKGLFAEEWPLEEST